MRKKTKFQFAVLAAAIAGRSNALATPALTTLASFTGTANGANPEAGLTADAAGNLYGTTFYGGTGDSGTGGTVFELGAGTNTLTTLATFNGQNGERPDAGLTFDASGNLFGTTYDPLGTIFELSAGTRALTTLATFNFQNGAAPFSNLILDASGNLYGSTVQGGPGLNGTVFELSAGSQSPTTLASFNGTNGQYPAGNLAFDASGNLYGTTAFGGTGGAGTVFEVAAGTHALTTLISFNNTNGYSPTGVIADAAGNLYGTTGGGGLNGDGTVFKVAAGTHSPTTLASFGGANGQGSAAGLIADASGNLYGTTAYGGANGDGTVFELNAATNTIMTLYSFDGTDGANPYAGLIVDAAGDLFGTTEDGGSSNDGTVFELTGSGFDVPEPNSIALLAVATPFLLTRRRKCCG
jgi:uncharacterized repeat protein (TIGR03803 family)